MYARCSVLQNEPATADQAVKVIREMVLPAAREVPGFQGVLAFLDRDSGKAMAFTLWDSAEARDTSAQWADKVRSEAAEEMGGKIVSVENYELVVDER